MTTPEKVNIVAFKAVQEKALTQEFITQHLKVLEDIGVISAIRIDHDWSNDPESTIIAAIHESLGMVGGVRLQYGRVEAPLAIERAVSGLYPEFRDSMVPLMEDGAAELCGLWVAHRFAGHGLPKLLVPAGVAVASQLNIKSLLTFAAEYTLPLTVEVGFSKFEEVGDKGELIYPIPSIRSYPLVINDLFTLSNSQLEKRHRILSLRLRPFQELITTPKRHPMFIRYALDRDQKDIDATIRRSWESDRFRLSA